MGTGQHIESVTFFLLPGTTSRIAGRAIDSTGRVPGSARVYLYREILGDGGVGSVATPAGTTSDDGTFAISEVPEGDYVIGIERNGQIEEQGCMPVSVRGTDIAGLVIATQPSTAISGRVLFVEGRGPEGWHSTASVMAVPVGRGHTSGGARARSTIQRHGSFTLNAVMRGGPHTLRVEGCATCQVVSVRVGDADITDRGLDFGQTGRIPLVEILLTVQSASLSGHVVPDSDRPADFSVLLFPSDESLWMVPDGRYLHVGRPANGWTFEMTGIPPGVYNVVALDFMEDGRQYDTEFLEHVKPIAERVELRAADSVAIRLPLRLNRW